MPPERARTKRDGGLQARERLLEAGTRLFSERGYAATSVGAICERAGVGKPALYWHFDSKEGLLAAVLRSLVSRWVEEIRKQTEPEANPDDRLRALVAEMRQLVIEEPQLMRLPTVAALEQAKDSERIRRAVLENWDRPTDEIARGTRAVTGIAQERAEGVAFVITTLLNAAAVRYSIDEDVERLDWHLRQLEWAVRGMVATSAEGEASA